MDIQLAPRIYESLQLLIGKVTQLESNQENIRSLIQEKINPSKKEFLDDQDLEEMFGITIHMRYKMVNAGTLKKYKLNGSGSKSLYKYDEVIEAIESGLIYPKKNNESKSN